MSYNFAEVERNGKKQRPKCAKCRNHGLSVFRLGHKGCCQYDDCDCDLCRQTKVRNEAMAKTMANERRRKKESTRGPNGTTTTSQCSSSYNAYGDKNQSRTSLSLQLNGYDPSNGGSISSYGINSGHRASSQAMTYTANSRTQCNPFSPTTVDTKVFGANSYNFYHHRQQFSTQSLHPYKMEPDRSPFLNTFGAQPQLTMIGTNK